MSVTGWGGARGQQSGKNQRKHHDIKFGQKFLMAGYTARSPGQRGDPAIHHGAGLVARREQIALRAIHFEVGN